MERENSGITLGLGTGWIIIFAALKLTNLISWSWYWVLAPITIPFTVIIGITVFSFSLAFLFLGIVLAGCITIGIVEKLRELSN